MYNPPATSSYSPPGRALVFPNARRSSKRVRNSFIVLYFVLQFWDKPLLQKVFRQLWTSWNLATTATGTATATADNAFVNRVVTSKIGISAGKASKKILLYLVKAIIKLAHITKASQVGILNVPQDIQQWADAHESSSLVPSPQTPMVGQKDVRANIDKVLKYWFGQYTPEKSQKQLWMIATSSQKYREQIDVQIGEFFLTDLISLSAHECIRNDWMMIDGWKGSIAAILVLDQMSRHVLRHNQTMSTNSNVNSNMNNNINNRSFQSETLLPDQKTFDRLALAGAQQFQIMYEEDIRCGMIPIPMMIFALMPLRHKSTLQSVGYVQSKVQEIADLHSSDFDNMIRRFRRATNRRMAVLQDSARREGKDTIYDAGTGTGVGMANGSNDDLVEKEEGLEEEDILEFHQFEANMDDAKKTQVVKTMMTYLNARGVHEKVDASCNIVKVNRDTPVIVSLSGGVDSMVIASALAYLRDHCGFHQLYIVAVHIDYGNRPESAAEAAYVDHYALEVLRLDKCIVRRIDEVTRGVTKRDEYELYSRNVRYDLYRQTIAECIQICGGYNPSLEMSEVGVMLGHHRGDVVENVISNSNKGCGPLDLSGMTALGKNDGVTIYRPLLASGKDDIYDYSHKYGVPYFKDTTPSWSTRGKLRNKLIPLLEELYGDGCLSNLATLAQESDQARDLFNKTALQPFMQKAVYYPMGVIFCTTEFACQGSYFWKIVLRELLHSIGLGMFSDKSTESFLKRILPKKITSGEF